MKIFILFAIVVFQDFGLSQYLWFAASITHYHEEYDKNKLNIINLSFVASLSDNINLSIKADQCQQWG